MILVGGVGELFQGDLDAGRLLVDRLSADVPSHVLVEELHYGAVAVSQRLEELRPDALVLAGARQRSGTPGEVRRRRVDVQQPIDPVAAQVAVQQAATGYVDIDLVLAVGRAFSALPSRTIAIEIEPEGVFGESVSTSVSAALEQAEQAVRREIRRLPLLGLADQIRTTLADGHVEPSPALETLFTLLCQLEHLDGEGRWAGTFGARDRLRRDLAEGAVGVGMNHRDWGLWWSLIEEVDRVQREELDAP